MKLTGHEKQEIIRHIEADKSLPEKYRFTLFGDKRIRDHKRVPDTPSLFPCSGCGLCCQNIAFINELKSFDNGEGICKYFDINLKFCIIYESRPDICKVDKMFELKYHKYFSQKDFYTANADICNQLQTLYGVAQKFRVKIIGD